MSVLTVQYIQERLRCKYGDASFGKRSLLALHQCYGNITVVSFPDTKGFRSGGAGPSRQDQGPDSTGRNTKLRRDTKGLSRTQTIRISEYHTDRNYTWGITPNDLCIVLPVKMDPVSDSDERGPLRVHSMKGRCISMGHAQQMPLLLGVKVVSIPRTRRHTEDLQNQAR